MTPLLLDPERLPRPVLLLCRKILKLLCSFQCRGILLPKTGFGDGERRNNTMVSNDDSYNPLKTRNIQNIEKQQ